MFEKFHLPQALLGLRKRTIGTEGPLSAFRNDHVLAFDFPYHGAGALIVPSQPSRRYHVPMFKDRYDAGIQLAEKLEKYRGKDAVVLALVRGGVVVGYEVARGLGLPLDIVTVRKIGAPGNPEYAVGAIDERGTRLMNEEVAGTIDRTWLAEESKRQKAEAMRRAKLYRGGRPALLLAGKIAILVDDGIATGLTMRLAAQVVAKEKPEKLVIAVPVAPAESLEALQETADEVITLEAPADFLGAVGAHYDLFEQVKDAEVVRLMERASEKTG